MKVSIRALIAALSALACASAFAQTNSLRTGPGPEPKLEAGATGITAQRIAPLPSGFVLSEQTFEGGNAEGWQKRGDCKPDTSPPICDTVIIPFGTGGASGGYISATDTYFESPDPAPPLCYFWNWQAPFDFVQPIHNAATYGGKLTYSTKMTDEPSGFATNGPDVIITGMSSATTVKTIALYGVETALHTDWQQMEVALDNTSKWAENNNPDLLIAPETVKSVLKSIVQLSIRGLYQQTCRVGAGSGLDSIRVTAGGAPAIRFGVGGAKCDMKTYELPIRAVDLGNLKISKMSFVAGYAEDNVGPASEVRLTGKLSELGWTLTSLRPLGATGKVQITVSSPTGTPQAIPDGEFARVTFPTILMPVPLPPQIGFSNVSIEATSIFINDSTVPSDLVDGDSNFLPIGQMLPPQILIDSVVGVPNAQLSVPVRIADLCPSLGLPTGEEPITGYPTPHESFNFDVMLDSLKLGAPTFIRDDPLSVGASAAMERVHLGQRGALSHRRRAAATHDPNCG